MSRRHRIDAAIEAFFAGNGAGEEQASLASFAEKLRSVASGPVPAPSAMLATMLAEGFSTEKGDLLATAASNVPGPATQAVGLPTWRKRRRVVGEFIVGLSVGAKAAFGISMAAASVTAAGAAGALPAPAQHVVSAAVEATTPFEFPDRANDKADFGKRVSTDARDGGVDGKVISEEAKHNGDAHRADGAGHGNKPTDLGQNGLDQANGTPAAGHVPTSLPSGKPDAAGSQAGTAGSGNAPDPVPAGPPTDTPPA
ncbi:MAG TPA: hypothetical protein VHM89_03750, partial [Acidimicrobiales bacterium]|nr:hypothetical protein [Acidimicrobiales bacterium]